MFGLIIPLVHIFLASKTRSTTTSFGFKNLFLISSKDLEATRQETALPQGEGYIPRTNVFPPHRPFLLKRLLFWYFIIVFQARILFVSLAENPINTRRALRNTKNTSAVIRRNSNALYALIVQDKSQISRSTCTYDTTLEYKNQSRGLFDKYNQINSLVLSSFLW